MLASMLHKLSEVESKKYGLGYVIYKKNNRIKVYFEEHKAIKYYDQNGLSETCNDKLYLM